MNFRADLHTHSTCSDGTHTPLELIQLAKEKGLSGLSITDHDTIAAYTPQLFWNAERLGLEILTGVEFSSKYKEHPVHILGYHFDLEGESVNKLCQLHVQRRRERNLAILEKLRKEGLAIADDALYPEEGVIGVQGRVHIAKLIVAHGAASSLDEAFQKWIGDGKKCFDPGASVSLEETLKAIHDSNGCAFVAHPHLFRKRRILSQLLQLPFDGVEGYYSKMPPSAEAPIVAMAKERGLLVSGGSDFHGENRPHTPLGCSWVDYEIFMRIRTCTPTKTL